MAEHLRHASGDRISLLEVDEARRPRRYHWHRFRSGGSDAPVPEWPKGTACKAVKPRVQIPPGARRIGRSATAGRGDR